MCYGVWWFLSSNRFIFNTELDFIGSGLAGHYGILIDEATLKFTLNNETRNRSLVAINEFRQFIGGL